MQAVLKNADMAFNNTGEVYVNALEADNLKLD